MSDPEGTTSDQGATRDSIIRAHRQGIAALITVSTELEGKLSHSPDGPEDADWRFYVSDLRSHLHRIIEQLNHDLNEENAERTATGALQAMQEFEERDFAYNNLREALKQRQHTDFDGAATVQHYRDIDLPIATAAGQQAAPAPAGIPGAGKSKGWWGKLVNALKSSVKQIVLWAIQLAQNALKLLPRFVSVKPVVGFSGLLPSLSFMIEAEGVTAYDIFDVLAKGLKE